MSEHVNHIKCAECKHVRHDPSADEDEWRAYECGNRKSVYFEALLNITRNGDTLSCIVWHGCEHGEAKMEVM